MKNEIEFIFHSYNKLTYLHLNHIVVLPRINYQTPFIYCSNEFDDFGQQNLCATGSVVGGVQITRGLS